MPTLLMIDDDQKLIDLLTPFLKTFGFNILASLDPEHGLWQLEQAKPDLIILDVMLPGMDGFEVCREIRKVSQVPIIMLTARGDVTDRVVGLEMGADDYLPKPFEPRELVARIQTVLRRSSVGVKDDLLLFEHLQINATTHEVLKDDTALELTTAEFQVLHLLASRPGKTYSRDQIIDALNGTDWASFQRSVDVLISRLRQKLGDDPKAPHFIRTIRGAGYRFIAKRRLPHA